jgi:hypothetical protein
MKDGRIGGVPAGGNPSEQEDPETNGGVQYLG